MYPVTLALILVGSLADVTWQATSHEESLSWQNWNRHESVDTRESYIGDQAREGYRRASLLAWDRRNAFLSLYRTLTGR